jgi:hypothetical protein
VVSMRKALFIATWGLSGLVLKDNSKRKHIATQEHSAKPEHAKAAKRQARPKKQAKVARPGQRTARRPTPQAALGTKPTAPQMAGRSAVAQEAGFGRGAINELERLAILHGRGALTSEEFSTAKAKILGTGPVPHQSSADSATFPAISANVAAARQLTGSAVHDRGRPIATEVGA